MLSLNAAAVAFRGNIAHPATAHGLGANCSRGTVSLHLFTVTLTAERFQTLLMVAVILAVDARFGGCSWYLVMDSDPKHTAGSTFSALQSAGASGIPKEKWPARLPDLYPIEHDWSMTKRVVRKERPKTPEQLKGTVRRERCASTVDEILHPVKSMPPRIDAAISK